MRPATTTTPPTATRPSVVRASPRSTSPGTGAHAVGIRSIHPRTASTGPSSPTRQAPMTAPMNEGTKNSSAGSRIDSHVSDATRSAFEVSATTLARATNTSEPDSHPVRAAPASPARTPERAANRAVKAANARGARERVNVAKDGSIPVAARYASGRVTVTGTRWPRCHTAAEAGHNAPQSGAPRPKTHSRVSGASTTAIPPAAARTASRAARRATRRRCMGESDHTRAVSERRSGAAASAREEVAHPREQAACRARRRP